MTQIVAHRGLRHTHPENTLEAIHAAIEAGAHAVEIDIQFSKDKVPILFHDESLQRTTGQHGRIFDFTYAELKKLNANESDRLGNSHPTAAIPALEELCAIMAQYPDIRFYIEIKRHSLQHFDEVQLVQKIINMLDDHLQQCWIISFHIAALEYVRANSQFPIGWVLRDYDETHHAQALKLQPDMLVCNHIKLAGQQTLWGGPWEWMVYELNSHEQAAQVAYPGVAHIETANVSLMKQYLAGKTP